MRLLNQLECCRGLGDVLLESYVYFLSLVLVLIVLHVYFPY